VKLTESPPLGLLIVNARRLIYQTMTTRLEPFGVTAQQFWVVMLLFEDAIGGVQDVGQKVGIDKAASSRLVKQLIARGWARFVAGDRDRRRRRVELTAAGRRQAQQFRSMAMQLSRELERGLGEAEKAMLIEAMHQVLANLTAAAARPARARAIVRQR
jgi:DNA-binding MarR family transcriptional regulator